MSSILHFDECMIEDNWYYSCLFSPKKSTTISGNEHIDVDCNYNVVGDDGKPKESIVGSKQMVSTCFESADSDISAKMCMEDEEEEAEFLGGMFRALDEDGDGRVSSDEIVRFLQRLNLEMPKDEFELAVRSVSACGHDFLTAIEFNEFYRIMFAEKEDDVENVKVEEKAICEAFNVFDQNRDGFISVMELADVLSRLGFVEGKDLGCCESMIESVDYNGDGLVDIHEFRRLIARTSYSSHTCLQCTIAAV